MMQGVQGKKLLVIGSSMDEVSMVQRARELGVYVIAADYFTEPWRTPAKRIADEAWDVDWTDVDAMAAKCRENHVDGVMAGYSEIKVDYMRQLCEKLGLPCYITAEQLEITRDKIKFKDACRANGVPTVREFASVDEVDEYPVIIKPVDRAGSIGISVASDRQELEKAYQYAMDLSLTKQVIIEKYIDDATKFDAYYAISGGEIVLLSSDDVINAQNNGYERVVQSAWLYPSIYHEKFLREQDENLRRFIRNIGIRDGYIFFSGFANEKGFVFFECGFRLCGGRLYDYYAAKGFTSNLDLFICHALTGSTAQLGLGKDKHPEKKLLTLNIYAREGEIAELRGAEEIGEMEDCQLSFQCGYVGEKCSEDAAILSKLAMFNFCSTEPERLKQDADRAYALYAVTGTDGRDMIYDRIDTSVVPEWWKKLY